MPHIDDLQHSSFTTTPIGSPALSVVVTDGATIKTLTTRMLETVAYAAGVAFTFTEAEAKTAYRVFNPHATIGMRVCEDAVNIAQANAWLNANAADTGSASVDQNHYIIEPDSWGEWQYFPDGTYLTNVYVSMDAAATGQVARSEAV